VPGDAFAPRNPRALKLDFELEPPEFQVSETHYASTWLLDPRAPALEAPPAIRAMRQKYMRSAT
jgi:oligopeptide transport system ATP-binding protein